MPKFTMNMSKFTIQITEVHNYNAEVHNLFGSLSAALLELGKRKNCPTSRSLKKRQQLSKELLPTKTHDEDNPCERLPSYSCLYHATSIIMPHKISSPLVTKNTPENPKKPASTPPNAGPIMFPKKRNEVL